MKDFPSDALKPWGIEAQSPDLFVMSQLSANRARVVDCVRRIAATRMRPPTSVADVVAMLERDGLRRSADALRQ